MNELKLTPNLCFGGITAALAITVDLSLLDKHDAEVRKPLVDALKRMHGLAETAIHALKGKLPNPDISEECDRTTEMLIEDLTRQIDALAKVGQ